MNPTTEIILTPTDFVALTNQTLEYAFAGIVQIEGELANFRISKQRWVYFDVKDDISKVACFASIYALPGPLTDGMMINISGQPRLHQQFGFSFNVQTIRPSGEGSIKKAFELLKAALTTEGLFNIDRKRQLPYPPANIALVTSLESAAYADFIKILNSRWPFARVNVYDVQVQGESAPGQIVQAINIANGEAEISDVLVITRGGGSADDLAAFNDERVVRAIAGSRLPTLVAIGHEIDESLAELAADRRASTPSNAAELLVPDRKSEQKQLVQIKKVFAKSLNNVIQSISETVKATRVSLMVSLKNLLRQTESDVLSKRLLLSAYNPEHVLKRGYAMISGPQGIINSVYRVAVGDKVCIKLSDGSINAKVDSININEGS